MTVVNLIQLVDSPTGGWPTFTAHLHRALEAAGAEPRLFKVAGQTRSAQYPFGRGLMYQNLSPSAAAGLAEQDPTILTAVGKKNWELATELIGAGAVPVIHDPNELASPQAPDAIGGRRVIVVRPAMLPVVQDVQGVRATFIPHPYQRLGRQRTPMAARPLNAITICRVDFDKHIEEVLEANRLLPPAKRIWISGYENRQYTHFKLDEAYPEWRQSYLGPMPKEDLHAGVVAASRAKYVVDLSRIPNDGGGTQYTTLEAWDAGSRMVQHRAWLTMVPEYDTVAQSVALIHEVDQLVRVVKGDHDDWWATRQAHADLQLQEHDPVRVGRRYLEVVA